MSEQNLEYWRDQAMRHAAATENVRKRLGKQLEDEAQKSVHGFAKDLLGVVDSLEKAKEHGVEGAESTLNMLTSVFKKYGIESFDPTGKSFDPSLHEAISMQPSQQHEVNMVITCVQTGYKINNQLIRAAKVVVSSGPNINEE